MGQSKKTRSKNRRNSKRGGKNKFWLVMSTRCKEVLLFERKPYKETFIDKRWLSDYKDGFYWFSCHGKYYLSDKILERIPIDHTTPIKVKLIICNNEPDLYIQRWKDCLFVNSRLEKIWPGGDKHKEIVRVSHNLRLSNKLFPDVTEESGIVGLKVVKL